MSLPENTGNEQTIKMPRPAKHALFDLKSDPHKIKIIIRDSGLAKSGIIL